MVALVDVLFVVLKLLNVPVFPAIVLPVRLATVVDARVEEPETVRLVNEASVATKFWISALVIAANTDERPCDDEVPVIVVELNNPVPPLKVLALMVLPAIVRPVKLETVVDPSVEDAVTKRF